MAEIKNLDQNQLLLGGDKSDRNLRLNTPTNTFAYVEANPEDPPFMRASPRFQYLEEYLGYWMDNKRYTVLAIFFLVAGLVTLSVFLPLGLLFIMIGAKYRNQAWWDDFIYGKFGRFRSLVMVD
jgi:hypothetical protein